MELNKNSLLTPAEFVTNRVLNVGREVVSRINRTYGLGRVAISAMAEYSAFETSHAEDSDQQLAPIIPINSKSVRSELRANQSIDAS